MQLRANRSFTQLDEKFAVAARARMRQVFKYVVVVGTSEAEGTRHTSPW